MDQFCKTAGIGFLLICTLAVSSCGINKHKLIPTPGMERYANNRPRLSENNSIQPLYVGVLEAQEWVGNLRDAYMDAANAQRDMRVLVDSTLIATAVMAIQRVAVAEKTTSAANLALAGTGIAFLSQRAINPMHKDIYAEGARALNCVYGAATQVPIPTALGDLQWAMTRQLEARLSLSGILTSSEIKSLDSKADNDLKQNINNAQKFLSYSDVKYKDTNSQLAALDPRGREIIFRAFDIHIAVEKELNHSEPQPLSFHDALQQSLTNSGNTGLIDTSTIVQRDSSKNNIAPGQNDYNELSKKLNTEEVTAVKKMDEALNKLSEANDNLGTALLQLRSTGTIHVPATAFDRCSYVKPTTNTPLQLSSKAIALKVASGKKEVTIPHVYEIVVTGGKPPYKVVEEILSQYNDNVKATFLQNKSDPYILRVKLNLTAAWPLKLGSPIFLVVQDSEDQEQTLMFKAEE